jgi:hypothetical protein
MNDFIGGRAKGGVIGNLFVIFSLAQRIFDWIEKK